MRGKDLHLDCFNGLAGDMFLGACLDLGMPESVVEEAVAALKLHGIGVESRKARRAGFAGTRFRVLDHGQPIEGPDPEERAEEDSVQEEAEKLSVREGDERGVSGPAGHSHRHVRDDADHRHGPSESNDLYQQASSAFEQEPGQARGHGRHLAEILALVEGSALSGPVKARARALFHRLGEAEAKAHGMAIERVHFHEVGAVDSIVDLVGAAAAVEWLAPRRITCGAVNLGGGSVSGAHGRMPVPPPAVAELMKGLPVYGSERSVGELLTPTGAVLLAELVDDFVELPAMIVEGVGYGLGRKETPGCANAVRLIAAAAGPQPIGRRRRQLGGRGGRSARSTIFREKGLAHAMSTAARRGRARRLS